MQKFYNWLFKMGFWFTLGTSASTILLCSYQLVFNTYSANSFFPLVGGWSLLLFLMAFLRLYPNSNTPSNLNRK
jgi:hypothetical protein